MLRNKLHALHVAIQLSEGCLEEMSWDKFVNVKWMKSSCRTLVPCLLWDLTIWCQRSCLQGYVLQIATNKITNKIKHLGCVLAPRFGRRAQFLLPGSWLCTQAAYPITHLVRDPITAIRETGRCSQTGRMPTPMKNAWFRHHQVEMTFYGQFSPNQ